MSAAALLVALMIDCLAGEPPAALHPVVWLGRLIDALRGRAPGPPVAAFVRGTAVTAGTCAAAWSAALFAERAAGRLALPLRVLAFGALLKPAFSLRELLQAAQRLETALIARDLPAARVAAGALVSRYTDSLDEQLLAAAAIESLAENLTDSVVAPLLAYVLGGLPGAYAYRAINTLDSMIGYRGRYEWLGKPAARLDDLVNLVPARLAAIALSLAAPFTGASLPGALRTATGEHGKTVSPNAGWTMAAAAGALGVRLEKVGVYVLNPGGKVPGMNDVERARRLVRAAALLSAVTLAALAARAHRNVRH